MTDLSKTPVTVITGFLGSGKTTLVRHLMQNPQGKRLAIVVNEFGDVGVDGEILKSCAIPDCPAENILELANGCICCTVADDFIPTIEALMALDPKPEHILIETSGLALPKPLLKAFDWPDIRSRITVDGVIALADAEAVAAGRFAPDVAAVDAQREADDSLDHETPLSEVFEDQIACADIILLTKPDLAGADGVAKAKAMIADHAPRALPMVEVAEGAVDPRVILGLEAAAEDDIDARPSHHEAHHHHHHDHDHDHHHHHDHDHDDFDSIVVNIPELTDPAQLVTAIEAMANDLNILRVKGYAAVAGKPMRLLVQAVGARVRHQFDRPWKPDEARQGRLVVIGQHDDIVTAKIHAALGVVAEAAE
ncbi:cobalamin biosynthesis protein CobW [Actibacterium mucosum KCTC 23349]|uniref:Cobalamin biosynthesis protein CobW n=1 Tax=Actibacterium mucosum KCTC 23349 TaxID=1454373 RepID=A0A037ZHZ8_9RHOB|nr:cobalamin biosynthesis protein CobW [Actibacterium mucosum]KAJ55182.1 cobalamin biosynthesis protein CobW [Actibacterium mucosum KCTC 23349]